MAEAAQANVVISAVDKATEVIRGITGQFDSLQSKWASVSAALGVGAGVAALTSLVKSSIEAADNMGDLAAQVGVGVETLSKYKLAAEASGTSLEGLGAGLKKLSVNMFEAANGSEEAQANFAALGIAVKDSSGNLRSADDVLLDLADSFAGMEDGTAKTALAIKVLGKSGAELIPFLNNGREGLQEFAATAEALGITLDERTVAAADRTNDMFGILAQVTTGFGNRVMKEVLPTLEGLAAALLDSAKKSGALETAAQGVASAFKLVVSVGLAAFNALQAVGGAIGGVVAATVQAVSGDFKGAWETLKTVATDSGKRVVATAEQIGAVWTESLGTVDKKTVDLSKSFGVLEKQSKAAKQAADDYARAQKTVQELTAKTLGVSGDYVAKLKDLELWYGRNADKTEEYVAAVEALIRQQPFYVAGLKAQEEAQKAANKAAEEAIEADEKQRQAREDSIRSARLIVEGIQNEADALRMTSAEREIATKLRELEKAGIEQGSEAYRIFAERIREAVVSKDAIAANIEANKTIADTWRKTGEQIEQALTDAMVKGFTEGKSVVKSVGEWIKNYFLTSIARSIAQSIAGALAVGFSGLANAAGLGGLFGGGAGGAGGGASGGGLGTLTNLASLGGSLFGAGGLGGALAAGAGWLTGATTLTGALTAAGSLIGTGTAGGMLAGLGMGAGALGPIALGAYALYEIFGKRNKSSPAQQNYTAIGSTDFGYSGSAPNLQSTTAYQSVLEPIVTNVAALVARLGGTVGNTSYGIYTSASPDGKGATVQVNAAGSTGELFKAWSNAANETMQQRVEAALPGLLAAGLKDANLPEEIAAIFRELDPNTATIAQIDAAIEKALALAPQQEEADQAQIDTYEAVQANSEVLLRQADLLDKLNTAVERLAQIAESGLNATAAASADAGREVVRAVLTLAPAEVNGGAL